MVRAVLERAFDARRLDALYDKTAEKGYTWELLFSAVVRLMSEVVLGVSPSVHAAYQGAEESLGVSIAAVYDKLAGIEPQVSAELVRDSMRPLAPLIRCLGGELPSLSDGYRVLILDGNQGQTWVVKMMGRLVQWWQSALVASVRTGSHGGT